MAGEYDQNILLDSEFTYQQYAPPVTFPTSVTNISGSVTIINTINGRGGSNVIFNGGTTGLDFGGTGNTFSLDGTLVVANGGTGATTAAGARANLGAAASGVNVDITQLNGASQVDVSGEYKVSGVQVVTAQQAAVPDASGGVTVDTEARAAINSLLAALRIHGLIDT
jgi:hypothetical protein